MSLAKSEEIRMLRNFCLKLGDRDNSYTGEWLTAELPNLERAIVDDMPPQTYAKNYREAEAVRAQMINDAREYANRLKEEADSVMRNAQTRAEELLKDVEERRIELIANCRRAESHIANARQALAI